MTFSLRDATLADIPAITEIYRDSVLNGVASYEMTPPDVTEMRARFESITGNGYPYVTAVDEKDTVIGYAYASSFRTRPAYRFIVENSIYLAPDARGRGIGKILLSELTGRCTALGFRQMLAVIGGAHPASVALHRAAGFEFTGQLKGTGFKHGRWLDTALMQLALGEGTASDPEPGVYPDTLFNG